MLLYAPIERCRACGSARIPEVLNLGDFALSDFLDSPEAHTDRAPLVVVRCTDCTLVQLQHTVDRDRLYRRYWYRSGTQPAMVAALQDVVDHARRLVDLQPGDTWIDIGANDGTLLRMVPDWCRRVAYEPAENLWPDILGNAGTWSPRGITLEPGYFPSLIGGQPVHQSAKVITSLACFYDVDDPHTFVEGIARALAPDGVWINQLAYLPDTLKANNFGDFCHEHLTYWTGRSFTDLIEQHGLTVRTWACNDINGGSIRFVVGRGRPLLRFIDAPTEADCKRLGDRAERQTYELQRLLSLERWCERTVVGYGASTKGNTYLQYWGLRPDVLPTIADRNPEKWGTYTPTGQRIISEDEMRAQRPDYLLVLPWHFLDAFVERERDLLEAGTRLIVPFPELRVLGGADVSCVQPEGSAARG